MDDVQKLVVRVKAYFDGVAIATGCKLEYEGLNEYSDVETKQGPSCLCHR